MSYILKKAAPLNIEFNRKVQFLHWNGEKFIVYSTLNGNDSDIMEFRWFSVGICKYKPGYKSHYLLKFECSHWLKLQHSDWKFYTNESTRIYNRSWPFSYSIFIRAVIGHMICYN